MSHAFQLDTPWPADAAEGLGLWSAAAGDQSAASFARRQRGGMPGWRIDLPTEPQLADGMMRMAQDRLRRTSQALDHVPRRIERLIQHVARKQAFAPQAPHVRAAGPETVLPETWPAAERELVQLLLGFQSTTATNGAAAASVVTAPLAPGALRGIHIPGWSELERRFREFIERLQHWVLQFAYVETRADGRLVARTTLSWTGDLASTWWLPDPVWMARHVRALKLAVSTRMSWLRIVMLTAEAAVKLAARLALPFGAWAALPVAWHYVQRILDEI